MKTKIALIVLCLGLAVIGTTFDKSVPADDNAPSGGAERIRNLAAATQEIENVEHYWPLTGSQVTGTDIGIHRTVTFYGPVTVSSMLANHGGLHLKDVDGGSGALAELYFYHEDEKDLQITEHNTAGDAVALNITGTYENEVAFTNTANQFYTDSLLCTSAGVLNLPKDTTDTTEGNLKYVNTGDTLQYRTAAAWLTLAASPTAAMIKVGTYTGDGGATKAITGVGFQPDVVFVFPGNSTAYSAVKTADMGTTYCKILGTGEEYVTDSITALGADGFTVGDGGSKPVAHNLNVTGVAYFYVAAASIDNP